MIITLGEALKQLIEQLKKNNLKKDLTLKNK